MKTIWKPSEEELKWMGFLEGYSNLYYSTFQYGDHECDIEFYQGDDNSTHCWILRPSPTEHASGMGIYPQSKEDVETFISILSPEL